MKRALAVAAVFAAASAAHAQAYDVREGMMSYSVVHKLHEVRGTTRAIEGRAVVASDGTARVQVRAKVASFDSGNSNRDEHMREVTHEAEHVYCSVKGTASGVKLPLDGPQEIELAGTVELNGQRVQVAIPVKLVPDGKRLRAIFSFAVSLGELKIERPSLLFVKVDDKLTIEGDLFLE